MRKLLLSCLFLLCGFALFAAPDRMVRQHQKAAARQQKAVVRQHQKAAARQHRAAVKQHKAVHNHSGNRHHHSVHHGHRRPPAHFRGWRRGHVVHPRHRSCWVDGIWYDAYGYPCYSPEYLAVTPVANTVVYTAPGAVVAPAPVVVAPAPQPTTVIVTPPPPPPPPPRRTSPVGRLIRDLL